MLSLSKRLLPDLITFTLCVGKVKFPLLIPQSFELAMQDSHPSLSSTKTLHHFYILIHSGSLGKILTVLLKLV